MRSFNWFKRKRSHRGRKHQKCTLMEAVQFWTKRLNQQPVKSASHELVFRVLEHDKIWMVIRADLVSKLTGEEVNCFDAYWIERCSGDVYIAGNQKDCFFAVDNVYGPPGVPPSAKD